ncbi:hypothetical protein Thini_2148 [Thiothrix nivea DSM 5205]|uniref:Uncharacterized protein n=1 Tax=Thiothrix nivea (strain ATCC 35100 / DSM 5205 / JP2) TaxID=870187 RepID=A0A656HI64_THINJ|nr:hypothetical protein Thini_2148 [Thiothrix nivea DSM 5205]
MGYWAVAAFILIPLAGHAVWRLFSYTNDLVNKQISKQRRR